ncbi:MAG: LpxI family protein [Vampirovibrionia bacterium]
MIEKEIINNKFAIIAGNGKLPELVANNAKKQGIEVYSICYDFKNYTKMKLACKKAVYLGPGQLQKAADFLLENEIKQVLFIGKVSKEQYFRNPRIDKRAIKALSGRKRLNDDAIMHAAVEELEKENIEVLEQTIFIKEFFAKKGLITGKEPDEKENEDIKYGFETAKIIGKMDIGQTVVVQDKMILAIEAIEGTDKAIKRGCELGNGKAVVVKVSKPSQDQRFDIPVVGMKTLKTMKKYGAKILAIEADETLIVNEEEFKKLAERYNITVIAV